MKIIYGKILYDPKNINDLAIIDFFYYLLLAYSDRAVSAIYSDDADAIFYNMKEISEDISSIAKIVKAVRIYPLFKTKIFLGLYAKTENEIPIDKYDRVRTDEFIITVRLDPPELVRSFVSPFDYIRLAMAVASKNKNIFSQYAEKLKPLFYHRGHKNSLYFSDLFGEHIIYLKKPAYETFESLNFVYLDDKYFKKIKPELKKIVTGKKRPMFEAYGRDIEKMLWFTMRFFREYVVKLLEY